MYCRNCGEKMDPQATVCSFCGHIVFHNEVHENKQSLENYQILVRSVSCKKKLDEWKGNFTKMANRFQMIACAPFLIYFAFAFIMYLNNKKRDIPEMPVWLGVFFFVILIVAVCFSIWRNKMVIEQYTKYNGYCAVESLLVDTEKVFGSTSKGNFTLKYEQIRNVSLKTEITNQQNIAIFTNDTLYITDVAGNCFKFYSFENCLEIRAAVESQMIKLRENKHE